MNLKQFYEPHPGLAGASVEIPEPVRLVAERLDGQSMALNEAVTRIKSASDGAVKVADDAIGLELKMADGIVHMFRVIMFRDLDS